MAKSSGLGDNFYVGGYDLSGNVSTLSNIQGKTAPLVVTAINKSAEERLYGVRDGLMAFTTWFDPQGNVAFPGTPMEHQALSLLPTADTLMTYFRGTALAGQGAALNAKQVNYDGKRDAKGNFSLAVNGEANLYGLEWGTQLTPGIRSDTTATNGTSIDFGAASSYGAQAYLQVFGVTGTSATVTIQHSTDNSTWGTLIAFSAVNGGTSVHTFQRATVSNTTTVDRYVRVITAGTFTAASFAVLLNVNAVAGVVF